MLGELVFAEVLGKKADSDQQVFVKNIFFFLSKKGT
jgi:hypothetical protein